MDVKTAIKQLEDAIRAEVRGEVLAVFGKVPANGARKAGRKGKAVKRNVPTTCVRPGCSNKATGPRYSYLCVDHRGKASKADKAKWLEAWRERNG